jgi:methylmalonyl-CoA mutase cobalamin-binding subunit
MENQIPLVRCQVQIKNKIGKVSIHTGLYRSTCDAAIDAIKQAGLGEIKVKIIGQKVIRGRQRAETRGKTNGLSA